MATVRDMFDSIDASDTKTDDTKREMDRVPDGTYKAVVSDFSVFGTGSGDFFVSWWFEIADGPASGAQLQSFSGVSPFSVKFIKRSVQRVTGSYPSWGDMYDEDNGRTNQATRSSIVGASVQITQKTNSKNGKDYVNVYVDKRLGSKPSSQEAPVSDDDVDVDDLF